MRKKGLAYAALLLSAMIWGATFVLQRTAMDHIGPFTLGCLRFFVGSAAIAPFALFRKQPRETKENRIQYWKIGVLCGLLMFVSVTLQQFGLLYTSAGKSGFVTGLYMIFVPFFAWLLFRQKPSKLMVFVVCAAAGGVFLLCVNEQFSVNAGDGLTLLCAVFLALHILLLARYGNKLDSLKLSLIQFLCCGAASAVPMLLWEQPTWAGIAAAAAPILYCGVLSVGFGHTAQTFCLKHVNPAAASLLMSTESVFSAVFGFLILRETLTARQFVGCALVFGAIVSSELLPYIAARRRAALDFKRGKQI